MKKTTTNENKKIFYNSYIKIILVASIIGIFIGIGYQYKIGRNIFQYSRQIGSENSLPSYSNSDLKKFDGTTPDNPIYIGLDGYVYDVTSGRKFYEKGGTYHYLAGKDSSKDLALIGGDIIKSKYPIVGKLNTN